MSIEDPQRIAANRGLWAVLIVLGAIAMLPLSILVGNTMAMVIVVLLRFLGALTHTPDLTVAIAMIATVHSVALSLVCVWPAALVRARPSGPMEAALVEEAQRISLRVGAPCPRMYVLEREAPNACTLGVRLNAATIAVTTGLLKLLTPEERAAVLAHGLSRLVSLDTLPSTAAAALQAVLRLLWDTFRRLSRRLKERFLSSTSRDRWDEETWLSDENPASLLLQLVTMSSTGLVIVLAATLVWWLPLCSLVFWFGDRSTLVMPLLFGPLDVDAWLLLKPPSQVVPLLLIPIAGFLLVPILARLLRCAASFHRDWQADTDAAVVTSGPMALAAALHKLKGARSQRQEGNRTVDRLFLVDPTPGTHGISSETHQQFDKRITWLAAHGISAKMAEKLEEAGAEHTRSDLRVSIHPETDQTTRVDSSVGVVHRLLEDAGGEFGYLHVSVAVERQ